MVLHHSVKKKFFFLLSNFPAGVRRATAGSSSGEMRALASTAAAVVWPHAWFAWSVMGVADGRGCIAAAPRYALRR